VGLGALGSCFESQHQLGSLALIYVHVLAVYYGVSYYLHYVSPQRHTKNVRSPAATQPEAQTERDALRAVFPLAIKALCLWGAHALHTCGWGIMSDGPILASWGVVDLLKAAATVLALDFFHDTWFYFVHRWLHTPTMMRYVHYIHHESRVPSAFTGYSFHWFEAIVMFGNSILEIFLFPMSAKLQYVYELWAIVIHIGGHCGWEIAPHIPTAGYILWWATGGWRRSQKLLNNVHHHDLHHAHPRCHFSLYFTHWDSLLGTMHESWGKQLEQENQAGGSVSFKTRAS